MKDNIKLIICFILALTAYIFILFFGDYVGDKQEVNGKIVAIYKIENPWPHHEARIDYQVQGRVYSTYYYAHTSIRRGNNVKVIIKQNNPKLVIKVTKNGKRI